MNVIFDKEVYMMKLGVCQMTVSEKLDMNMKKIMGFIEQAAGQNIDIVGFPEMALTGYTVELLKDESMNDMVSSALLEIRKTCEAFNTAAVIGHPYKKSNKLYNSTSVFLPSGNIYTYDKKYPTNAELEYFEPGKKDPLIFDYNGKKIGVMICRDQNYPSLAAELVNGGAKFIYILSAHFYNPKEARWKLEKNRAIPITRAVENGVYVMLTNFIGSHLGMISLGNSLIADPEGAVVASAGESEETLLSVSIL
ncbi:MULTISPECIES: carbon-nitrogen hydrolase family protein [Tepidanaerobacter]|uniref:carbon-nitrogen hydrolase family protein n=1 Tax=Tepidanaerobacter TaxID=499228 RepID=UPI0025F70AE9|nr:MULTISPECIES: carbon-nitrogen hydrolase family protein [Tepidanaerobacter]